VQREALFLIGGLIRMNMRCNTRALPLPEVATAENAATFLVKQIAFLRARGERACAPSLARDAPIFVTRLQLCLELRYGTGKSRTITNERQSSGNSVLLGATKISSDIN
jgi:hypothetical protein